MKKSKEKRKKLLPENPRNPANLAEGIPKKALGEIARVIHEDYKADKNSMSEWQTNRALWAKLFLMHRDAKTYPSPKVSNVCLPMVSSACFQFQARALAAIAPSKGVVRAHVLDGAAVNAGKRLENFLNYKLLYGRPSFRKSKDSLLMQLAITGSAFTKTYYDTKKKEVVSLTVPEGEVVVPFHCRTLEECPRISHAFFMWENDVRKRIKDGIFLAMEDLGPGAAFNEDVPNTPLEDAVSLNDGRHEDLTADPPRLIIEQHTDYDLDGDGIKEPYIITIDSETRQVLRIVSRTAPNGEEERYFTVFTFLKNPFSLFGVGFGQLLRHLNEAGSTIVNELIDSGHYQNTQSGFIAKRGLGISGDISFERGVFKAVDAVGDDLRKSIQFLEFPPPSGTLFNLLGLLQTYAERVSSVSDSMTGQLPSSDTTASSALAAIEQGMSVFSAIYGRVRDSLTEELRLVAYWYANNVDPEEYLRIQDSSSDEAAELVEIYARQKAEGKPLSAKEDFDNVQDVMPVGDPQIVSRVEKLTRAKEAYTLGFANPLIANDPEALYQITKELFEALEVQNVGDVVKSPKAEGPPPDRPPAEENAGFLREEPAFVVETQDHAGHVVQHTVFKESLWWDKVPPQGKKLHERHMQETNAAFYLSSQQEEAEIDVEVAEAVDATREEDV